jgi:hypothetical protein
MDLIVKIDATFVGFKYYERNVDEAISNRHTLLNTAAV